MLWINPNSFFLVFDDLDTIRNIDQESLKWQLCPDAAIGCQFLGYPQYSKSLSQSIGAKRGLVDMPEHAWDVDS